MARTQANRQMAIGTPLGDDALLLRGFTAVEELGRPFRITAELLSEDHSVDFSAIVGQNVTIRLDTTDGGTRHFNGVVSTFRQRQRTGRLATYEAVLVPTLWLLTRTSDCRIFQDSTVPDIILQILRDHGVTDVDNRLNGSYRQWEYCVQYRETDFNFVSRLMEQEGIYYFFEHEDGKHTLVLVDAATQHEPFEGYEEISFRSPSRGSSDLEHIRDWAVEMQVQPGAYAVGDFDFKNPRMPLRTVSRMPGDHAASDFEIYDYPGQYAKLGEGEKYARTRIEEFQAQHEILRGWADARGIATGYTFEFTDCPRTDLCRQFLVTSSTLKARSDEYDSESAGSAVQTTIECSFTGIDAEAAFRPASVTPAPRIWGAQTAIVVGPAGEEIYTDEYGRVKVKFHWDRHSMADETSSCWIRVAQAWAGKKWGTMFVPRIGQEVIVEFLEGDPDRPIITGRVYNGDEMPPYELPANKTRSTVKSNSSKGGGGYNEIRYEDLKGSEQIYIHAQKNEDERVGNDSKEWIGHDRHMIVKNEQFELVKADKHMKVEGDHNEKVQGTMSVEAVNDWQQKTGFNYAHEAGFEIHLKAGLNVVIEAGIELTLKTDGGSFIKLCPAGIFISGSPMIFINSGGTGGSGHGSSPTPPKVPLEADSDEAGEVDVAPPPERPPTPTTYSTSATVLQRASEAGAPFCEVCD